PSYRGAKLFNILLEEIKLQEESNAFRRELKRWSVKHPFHTIDEFTNWRTRWNLEV
ncbi:hypothetical protein J6590_030901, partial [Homalodisca vitripennis]